MRVTTEDIVALTEFSLLWRWTQETHAKFTDDELASIKPIRPGKAAAIYEQIVAIALAPSRPEDRIVTNDDIDTPVVSKWLEDRIPRGDSDVLLLWNRQTAALVPRRLFIDRWDDFWYPSSDDLSVIGIVGGWRVEMYHHGMFDFSTSGAVQPGVTPDGRSPSAPARGWTPNRLSSMNKNIFINLIAFIIGGIFGPSALVSAKSAQPLIDWNSILFAFFGCVIGAIFVIGIQIFRKDPKYFFGALCIFIPISMFVVGLGIGAIITGAIRADFNPATFFFIATGIGLLIGVFFSGVLYRVKFKGKL
ncbi:hypothetical protein JXQ70_17405 [bacterium]|nr:hypothetical protein [bacterium]